MATGRKGAEGITASRNREHQAIRGCYQIHGSHKPVSHVMAYQSPHAVAVIFVLACETGNHHSFTPRPPPDTPLFLFFSRHPSGSFQLGPSVHRVSRSIYGRFPAPRLSPRSVCAVDQTPNPSPGGPGPAATRTGRGKAPRRLSGAKGSASPPLPRAPPPPLQPPWCRTYRRRLMSRCETSVSVQCTRCW